MITPVVYLISFSCGEWSECDSIQAKTSWVELEINRFCHGLHPFSRMVPSRKWFRAANSFSLLLASRSIVGPGYMCARPFSNEPHPQVAPRVVVVVVSATSFRSEIPTIWHERTALESCHKTVDPRYHPRHHLLLRCCIIPLEPGGSSFGASSEMLAQTKLQGHENETASKSSVIYGLHIVVSPRFHTRVCPTRSFPEQLLDRQRIVDSVKRWIW